MSRDTHEKRRLFFGIVLTGALLAALTGAPARAAELSSVFSGDRECQVYPMGDGSGKYLVKSDGFYCVGPDGGLDAAPCVHYFDRVEINGTVFNGYYYHGPDGRFHAGNGKLEHLGQITCAGSVFEGFYMTGNLGKLSAAPQVRYLDRVEADGTEFCGYYYFDGTGRLVREPGVHALDMDANGREFRGSYYFGGVNGALVQEAGTTPEGFPVDGDGKVQLPGEERMTELQERLSAMILDYDGEWSIYVKNLNAGEEFAINSRPMTSASLIKTFIMAETFENLETVQANEAAVISAAPDSGEAGAKVEELLRDMITVSDNEASNELVRLQTSSHGFCDGALASNTYLEEEGYGDTSVQHTLHPSVSQEEGLGGSNVTSVTDCGKLLERIYKGTCVSQRASEEMKELLLNQETDWKIPAGISRDISVANKTGETDDNQHDIAIVYGPAAEYILCVMTEGCRDEGDAIEGIRDISRTVYDYLNIYENTIE